MATEAQKEMAECLAHFTDYFVTNYPGPNTIICDPKWHAPKIFRAAKYALRSDAVLAERDALRAVLREILDEAGPRELAHWDGGRWVLSADIPTVLIERAEKLLAPSELFAACTCDGVNECDSCKRMTESQR